MSCFLRFGMLKYIENETGKQPDGKIFLLMDKGNVRGSKKTLSKLEDIKVKLILPRTTRRIQTFQVVIIAGMEVCYQRRQMNYTARMFNESVLQVYTIEIIYLKEFQLNLKYI